MWLAFFYFTLPFLMGPGGLCVELLIKVKETSHTRHIMKCLKLLTHKMGQKERARPTCDIRLVVA